MKYGVVVAENSALKFKGIGETAQGSGDEGREGGKQVEMKKTMVVHLLIF